MPTVDCEILPEPYLHRSACCRLPIAEMFWTKRTPFARLTPTFQINDLCICSQQITTMATAIALLLFSPIAHAKQIGVIAPAQALTVQRVATLSPIQQPIWNDYLIRSQRQQEADRAALAAERVGVAAPPPPVESGKSEGSMPLNKATSWYGSPEAIRVADNIVSFQTPAGGWGKNQPRNRAVRQKGQSYVSNNRSKFLAPGDFDTPEDESWSYVGTIDNDATITEISFLAKVIAATKSPLSDVYRDSAIRGLEYLLAAQFPNGGWPQVWPLQGGYHDAYTINDNAVVAVAELLGTASTGRDAFAFVPHSLRMRAQKAEQRAVSSLLATQSVIGGRKTLWAQQLDALTLEPTSARNYEPAALCSAESASILMYLMNVRNPSAGIVEAVEGGIAALRTLAIEGKAWRKVGEPEGRRLITQIGAPKIWARYYDISTLQPIFGDRDKSLHDDVADISLERRNGYGWYGIGPQKALDAFEVWTHRRRPIEKSVANQ